MRCSLLLLTATIALACDPLDVEQALQTLPSPELPVAHFNYVQAVAGAAHLDNTPGDNALTDAGATLGRVLFYDVRLSQNLTRSCASCHRASAGFSDPARFSRGFDGGLTGRNSMSLINVRYYPRGNMFWDERADSLEEQVLMPIQDDVEMGLTLDELVQRVSDAPYYAPLFEDAFGDSAVDDERIAMALAQFVRSIVSTGAPFDEGLAATGDIGRPFPNFTDEENRGKSVFLNRCARCHHARGTAIFYGPRPENNGLNDRDDDGLGDGRFKSPSLRNVTETAPYMHDGRFDSLRAVMGHYRRELDLEPGDEDALIAFLETLTDESVANQARWQNPFPPPPAGLDLDDDGPGTPPGGPQDLSTSQNN